MKGIEAQVTKVVEGVEPSEAVDALIHEFPKELQERLEQDILDRKLNDQDAADYLVTRLIERKQALVSSSMARIPEAVEVRHDLPLAIIRSIEHAATTIENEGILGTGQNGKVIESVRQPHACYKVLYLERARELMVDIVREAVMQYEISVILAAHKEKVAQVPAVFSFVDHEKVRAIMMEKIKGQSLLQLMKEGKPLPAGFDVDLFFDKLEGAIELMNEHGYFHRDLVENAGNVMVGEAGEPYIVDFGSTVRSIERGGNPSMYQLVPNGTYYKANDLSGIRELKARVRKYLHAEKEIHD